MSQLDIDLKKILMANTSGWQYIGGQWFPSADLVRLCMLTTWSFEEEWYNNDQSIRVIALPLKNSAFKKEVASESMESLTYFPSVATQSIEVRKALIRVRAYNKIAHSTKFYHKIVEVYTNGKDIPKYTTR